MIYLLDTDICIYLITARKPELLDYFEQKSIKNTVGISSVTASELWFGVKNSRDVEQNGHSLRNFLSVLRQYSYDATAAEITGALRAELKRKGKPIGPYGFLIAAHTLALGAILIANNTAEFKRIPGLQIEKWLADA
ncbi:MAG: type II toxin-antitoxin system VapC family toxin [Spirochaetes bacterium]|nr:type II toxin-antitoxin system VapC family toxin [Spirochaetota bacterium]